MTESILNWGVAMESLVTTPVMGANITWLQNMSSLVGYLCIRAVHVDTLAVRMC
jgi:hypothetical protein